MGGKSKKSKSTSKSKPKVNRARQKLKAKIAGKTLKGRLAANFSQKQLSNLKTQHASFKAHQKAGTLSTHQKKYSTGSYSLSGAQRAQQAAKDRIAGLKVKPSESKSWAGKLKDSITTSWKDLTKFKPDNYKNLPGFMGDAQVTSGDWTRAKDTAVNIGKWGLDRLSATGRSMLNDFKWNHAYSPANLAATKSDLSKYGGDDFALVAQADGTYKTVPKSDYNTWAKRFGYAMSDQDSGIIGMTTAAGKGYVDNLVRATTMLPEKGWGSLWGTAQRSRDYLRTSQYKDPTLRAAYDVGSFIPTAQLAQGGVGLVGNIGKLGTKGRLLQSIVPATAKTFRGATLTSGKQLDRGLRIAKGIRDGTYTGSKAQQISSALKSGNLKSLGLKRVYHGTSTDAARKITQGALTGTGKGFRESMGMLGKGAYSSTKRGVAGSYRGNFLKGTPFNTNINLTPGNVLGAGVGAAFTGAKLLGQTNRAYEKAFPEESRTKSLLNFLNSTPGTWLRETAEKNIPGATDYLADKAEALLQPAFEMTEDMKGFKGGWARKQVRRAKSELANRDLSGFLDRATMVSRTYEKHEGKIPGVLGLVKGGVGDAWNRFLGRDPGPIVRGAKSPTRNNAMSIASGRGRGGKMRVQDVDLNKIGDQTSNIYAAAQDEQDLTAFWQRQNLINTAAEQRLKDIQSDRSNYANLQSELTGYGDQYVRELDRIKPLGQQYIDELARLQPYDKQFTSSIADLTKGRDELRGYRGQWTHPDDVKFLDEQLPQYDKAISDLESQYKGYQTSIADLTKGQKDYQSYLSELQTGQKELGAYRSNITKQQSELEDYSKAFTSAKQASDQAARSYTVRAQQGISGNVRQGVSGIRTGRGFRTIGSNRDKSPKRRFNRDFRIQSLNV